MLKDIRLNLGPIPDLMKMLLSYLILIIAINLLIKDKINIWAPPNYK